MDCYATSVLHDGFLRNAKTSYHAAAESFLGRTTGTHLNLRIEDIHDCMDSVEAISPAPSPTANSGLFLHALYDLDVSSYIKEIRSEFMDCENAEICKNLAPMHSHGHGQPLQIECHQGFSSSSPFLSDYALHRAWAPSEARFVEDHTSIGDSCLSMVRSASYTYPSSCMERSEVQCLPSSQLSYSGGCRQRNAWTGTSLYNVKQEEDFAVYDSQCDYESHKSSENTVPLSTEANHSCSDTQNSHKVPVFKLQCAFEAPYCQDARWPLAEANKSGTMHRERTCAESSVFPEIVDKQSLIAELMQREAALTEELSLENRDAVSLPDGLPCLIKCEKAYSSDDNGEYYQAPEPVEHVAIKEKSKKSSRRGRRGLKPGARKPRLYNFLREILADEAHRSCIEWINHKEGSFKFIDSTKVAQLWGERKNKPNMKYENFARSLRTYITKGILKKPRNKLVYSFADPSKASLSEIRPFT